MVSSFLLPSLPLVFVFKCLFPLPSNPSELMTYLAFVLSTLCFLRAIWFQNREIL